MKVQISTMLVFGEKEIPVGVAGATTETNEIQFKNMHACGTPTTIKKPVGQKVENPPPKIASRVAAIQTKAFCPACKVEVDEIVKGFEYAKALFLTFTEKELATIKPDELKVIQLNKFVPKPTVTPLMVNKSYFLVPNPNVPASYGQLYAVLAEGKLIGIGTMNLWGKEQPCAVYADQSFEGHSVLMMQLLHLQEDRITPDYTAPIPDAAGKKVMKELVTALVGTIEPEDLQSAQRARLNKLVAQKLLDLEKPEPVEELTEVLKPSRKKKVAA